MITLRVVDLFAGCGGLTRGFHDVSKDRPGFRYDVIAAVEADRNAAATYSANFVRNLHRKVLHHMPIEEWHDIPGSDVTGEPAAHVVVGGPPCQGFSNLGLRSPTDPRNRLWQEYMRVLNHIKPYYFVMENVAAFLKSQEWLRFHEATDPGGPLEDYEAKPYILNAAEFGVPQIRKRAVVIGRRRDRPPVPAPEGNLAGRPAAWMTVRQAFAALDPRVDDMNLPADRFHFGGSPIPGAFRTSQLHLTRKLTPRSLERFRDIPEGGNRKNIRPELLAPCWVGHDKGSLDVMGRLRWDQPSVTIRTEFVKPEKGRYLHPTEHRPITLAEAARLQTFPMDFLWCGAKVQIARQIGNAVPVQLARELGKLIGSQFTT